jgi:HEAT repeat protein
MPTSNRTQVRVHSFSFRVACACLLLLTNDAFAIRSERPSIGDLLREADLVVMADLNRPGWTDGMRTVRINRVLKGRLPSKERELRIGPSFKGMWKWPVMVGDEGNVALILRRSTWSSSYEWYPTGGFVDSEGIQSVQALCALQTVTDGRRRLLELASMVRRGVPHMRNELIAEIKSITDPKVFPVVFQIYDRLKIDDHAFNSAIAGREAILRLFRKETNRLNQANAGRENFRARYVEVVGEFGDKRAVPFLIGAFSDRSWKVRRSAAEQLYAHFRDVPGVTEALRRSDSAVADARLPYGYDWIWHERDPLANRFYDPNLIYATRLRLAGNAAAAHAVYWRVIERKHTEPEAAVAALALLHNASHADRDKICALLLPHIAKRIANARFSWEIEDVRLIRQLRHPACGAPLLTMLTAPQGVHPELLYEATLGATELGYPFKQGAIEVIINGMKVGAKPHSWNYVASLFWLGTPDDVERVLNLSLEWYSAQMKLANKGLLSAHQDEAGFLLARLAGPYEAGYSVDWIFRRLGELRDSRAIDPLLKAFKTSLVWEPDVWYQPELDEALLRIKGSVVESEMVALLEKAFEEPESFRLLERRQVWGPIDPVPRLIDRVTYMLLVMQGTRGNGTAREILLGDAPGSKVEAIRHLGSYGNKDDGMLLQSYLDFWSGDRQLQSYAIVASALLRERWSNNWLIDPD